MNFKEIILLITGILLLTLFIFGIILSIINKKKKHDKK